MKLAKQSNTNKPELRSINTDLTSLFTALQGRIRFGDGGDGDRGENLSGEFQLFTSHASANTEFSVTHTLGSVPVGYLILGQDKAGRSEERRVGKEC